VSDRPPLTVLVTVREGLHEIGRVLDALLGQLHAVAGEAVIVGPVGSRAPDPAVRLVHLADDNLFRLRLAGIEAARGHVVAIGEDHAVPRPDWCDAVIRAHAERPDIQAIAGCLVNATDRTLSGRANFLAFAAPYAPPMAELPPRRPPPLSALSLKRQVLEESYGRLGHFETVLVPRLFADGLMAADDRIVVDHHQDFGVLRASVNGFHGARAAYGYLHADLSVEERVRHARWSLMNWPRRTLAEAGEAVRQGRGGSAELAVVAVVAAAHAAGAALGSLAGPGRSPARVA
jgi:hypothetical protein